MISVIGYSQLPKTDVYLLECNADDVIKISFLNGFNKSGYNDQPTFKDNNNLFLVSNINDADQTDILLLNLTSGRLKRLTNTSLSEFSPRLHRNTDFSVVKVLENGKQVIWEYPLSLEDVGATLLSIDINIGYYQHLPNFKMALYGINEDGSTTLEIADLRRNTHKTISSDISRCLVQSAGGNLLFIKKGDSFFIKKYNPRNGQISIEANMMHKVEDFMLYKNHLIYGFKSIMYIYDYNTEKWVEWIDLKSLGITNITRMISKGNKIVLVNKRS